MIRCYGVLSSHSSQRKEVVPEPPLAIHNPLLEDAAGQLALGFDDSEEQQRSSKRRPWAWLLRHVWEVDVSTCKRCGGAMKWVEVATEPDAIARVLAEHGRGHDGRRKAPPPPSPSTTPQLRFGFG